MRLYQFLPALREAGIDVTVAPLFSDSYVRDLQSGRRRLWEVAQSYARRLDELRTAASYDLIWMEKDILPWVPTVLERLVLPRGVPYIVDYDDAVFHQYDMHSMALVRQLLGGKHADLVRSATLVTAGNRYLADFARKNGSTRVEQIPTVVDLDRYHPREDGVPKELPCVGWIGQKSTAAYLNPLRELFEKLARARTVRFVAVGIDPYPLGLAMQGVPWSEETEVQSIGGFDIGIMPLPDGPFEQGKCGYKLIQYMACGLPVIASPVGCNVDLVEHGVNGYLAESVEQWETALSSLLSDPALRQEMGKAGRRKVQEEFSVQTCAPRLVELFRDTAAGLKG